MSDEKVKVNYLRRWAKRLGLRLHKSRAKKISIDILGGYRLVDIYSNNVVGGEKYDCEINDVEKLLKEYEDRL